MPIISERTVEYVIKARDETARTMNKFEGRLKNLNARFAGMRLKMLGFTTVAVAGIAKLAQQASKLEQLEIGFTTMLGSAEAARAKIEELSDFAQKTPFTLPGVENAARSLLAVGFSAEELIPTLKAVGDVSAGLGRGEEGLQRLILNLGQVRTQGKLTGRELRDFAVLGVPLIDELAKSLGKTKKEITEMTSAGEITDEIVTQAFKNMTEEGGRFANLMAKQNKTLLGQWSNMKDALTLLARELGEPLVEPLTKVTQKVIKFAEAIGKFVEENPELVKIIADAGLKFTALLAVLTAILFLMPVLAIALSPMGAIGVAITGLIMLISTLTTHWEALKAQFIAFAELVKFRVSQAIDYIKEKFTSFFNSVEAKLRSLANTARSLVRTITFGLIGGEEKRQTGGIIRSAQTLVGETGPELVSLPRGTKVYEAGLTRRMLAEGRGAQNIELNINGPIVGNVVVQNEADEDRLVEKIQEAMARIVQLRNLRAPA